MRHANVTRGSRSRRGGFTLTEIMIALGVLVVGMGMAAGAFHAGIQNHKATSEELLRKMIGENALAIAKARLTSADLPDEAQFLEDTQIGPLDKRFPVGEGSRYGYLVKGKKVTDDYNEIEVIPFKGEGAPEFTYVSQITFYDSGTVSKAQPKLSGWGAQASTVLPQGTVIVLQDKTTLELTFATVVNCGWAEVTLDKKVPAGKKTNVSILSPSSEGEAASAPEMEIMPSFYGRSALKPPA